LAAAEPLSETVDAEPCAADLPPSTPQVAPRRLQPTRGEVYGRIIVLMSAIAYGSAAVGVLATLLALAYARRWCWTGFTDKKLWDWLQLLGIPVALAAGVFVLNQLQSEREHRREDRQAAAERLRAADNASEQVLRTYLQQMSQLMLDRKLLRSRRLSEVRVVARTTTLTAVSQLDGERKGLVIRFLSEARLINGPDPKIVLRDADLRGVELENAVLRSARFGFAKLAHANFRFADLTGATFVAADLRGSDFTEAFGGLFTVTQLRANMLPRLVFQGANLSRARLDKVGFFKTDFRFANLTGTELHRADLRRADFGSACLTRTDFRDADLRDSKLDAAGRYVDFSGARTRGAQSRRRYDFITRSYKTTARFPAGWRRTGRTFSSHGPSTSVNIPITLLSTSPKSCK